MTDVDNRVVQMQFNNKQFENNIQTSIKSLDNLKAGLKLDESAKSLSNLERAGRSFSLAGISEGVQALTDRFSMLGIIGITALQNITNSAINAGKRIISSLTIDPIKTGFTEYETKMNAIQTFLTNTASKGTTLDDVNKALEELNVYADKTIYNFAQMTENASKFTAAGLGLNDSITVVKGLANVAAGFGVDATRMAGATYQMTQALSAGRIQLMDWKSMEQAGMAGELLQKALRETAKEMGVFVDANVPFRTTLESGWLTTDIFVKAMDKMAKDPSLVAAAQNVTSFTKLLGVMAESVQSGWAQTWEAIIGNKEQSTAFFTSLSNSFSNLIASSVEARNAMFSFWNANGGRDAIIEALSNAFKGLQMVLKPIGEAFREVFPAMTGQRLVDFSKAIRDITANFKIGDETAARIKNTFKGLFSVLDIGIKVVTSISNVLLSLVKHLLPAGKGLLYLTSSIGNVFTSLDEAIKSISGIDMSGLDSFSEKVRAKLAPFTKVGDVVGNTISNIADILKKVAPVFYNLASIIGGAFDKLRVNIVGAFNAADYNSIFEMINSGLFATLIYGLKKFVDSLTSITDKAGGFFGGLTGILDGVRGSLSAYQSQLKAGALLKIAIAVAVLSASLIALSMVDPEKLTSALSAVTMMFIELFAAMSAFESLSKGFGVISLTKITVTMIGMSIAILILSAAVTKLAQNDWNGIAKGLTAVAVLAGVLVGTAKLLSATSGALIKGSLGFILFAAAINVLANAVSKLGALDTASLAKGLIGVGVLAAELALFMRFTDLSGMGILKGTGLLLLAASLVVLANAVRIFSSIDTGSLIKGLLGVGVVLASVSAFVKYTGNAKNVISTAVSLTILGGALLLLSNAIVKMGEMTWDEMARGLISMAGALVAITIVLSKMPKNAFINSLALLDMGTALNILARALVTMGKMSWGEVIKALTTMSVALGVIAGMFIIMRNKMFDAMVFIVIASSIFVLSKALATLGGLSLVQVGTSLLALAGAFGVIGVAGLLLAPIIPAILALSGAVAILGVGLLAAGAGVLAFATALTALAVAGGAGVTAIVAIVSGLVGLIPFVFKTLAQGIIDFAKIIAEGAPIIAEAVTMVVLSIVTALITITPVVVDAIVVLLTKLLETLVAYSPKIVDSGVKLIIALLRGISNNIQEVVATAIEIVINFIEGISSMIQDVIQSGFDLMLSFINGLADSIRTNTPLVMDAITNLMSAIVESAFGILTGSITGFVDIGKNMVMGLINGIKSMIINLKEAVGDIAGTVIESAKEVLDINSPSKVFEDEVGKMIGLGLAKGINKSSSQAEKESEKMAKRTIQATKEVFDKQVEWINDRKYYNKLSLEEELYAWEQLQKKYKEGTEERKKADREVYRVQRELNKAGFENSVSWIDERKYYNQMSLSEELAAWERVQKRYLEGTEERKKADREVYRVKQELNRINEDYSQRTLQIQEAATQKRKDLEEEYYVKTKEINDKLVQDIQNVNKEYEDAVKSRADSLYAAYGLFDKVESSTPVSGDELIGNLESQVLAFESWQKNINELAQKGIDEGLIKELTDMGPKSAAQIDALNKMSKDKLDKYVSLWQTRHSDAKKQAIFELESMRIQTLTKIAELNAQAAVELSQYQTTWAQKMEAINNDSKLQLSALEAEWAEKIGSVTTNAEKEIDTMGTNIHTSVLKTRTETEKEFVTLAENIQTIMKTPDWYSVGLYVVDGMRQGIRDRANVLAQEAAAVALAALNAAKAALGVRSPSKEFFKIGMYADQGFANGLNAFGNVVVSSAKEVGESAIFALQGAISNISNVLEDKMDTSPVIRPVLDLSNIEAGGQVINSLFAQKRGISLSSIDSKIPNINRPSSTNETENTSRSGQSTQGTSISFTQHNYSPKPLSRLEIYRQTRNQISALKGLVSTT